ncbi:rod-binding protein [Sphingobium sufflavum]|nr:rod-binding protein [Sphingobium sufflavum]
MATKIGTAAIGAVTGAVSDAAAEEKAKLEKTAKAFEAVFVRQLIGSMRSAGFGDDLTGSSAVDQFQEMSDARTADNMAEQGGLGIAEMLLSRLAPKAKSAAASVTALANKGQGE